MLPRALPRSLQFLVSETLRLQRKPDSRRVRANGALAIRHAAPDVSQPRESNSAEKGALSRASGDRSVFGLRPERAIGRVKFTARENNAGRDKQPGSFGFHRRPSAMTGRVTSLTVPPSPVVRSGVTHSPVENGRGLAPARQRELTD